MLIKIRDYFSEDWPAIETILRMNPQIEIQITSERKLINLYIQQYDIGRTSVATDESNSIIGYMILRHYRESSFIETIFVDKRSQRNGVGSQLIEHAKTLAIMENSQVLRVAVPENNRLAIKFFVKNDFQVSGFIKSDYSLYNNNDHLTLPLVNTNY